MFVYKISWLPYIFSIVGVIMFFSGEIVGGLVVGGLGGVMVYFKHFHNKPKKSSGQSTANVTNKSTTTTARKTTPHISSTTSTTQIRFCQHCGAKLVEGAKFCSGCGKQL